MRFAVKCVLLLTTITQTQTVTQADQTRNNPGDYFYYHNKMSDDGEHCSSHADCPFNELCQGTCQCEPFHMRDQNGWCRPCPLEGQYCTKCCFGPMLECLENRCVKCHYFGNSMQCVTQEEFYIITAAQVTLVAAFAILIVVLCGILYHRCTRNSAQARRRRAVQTGTLPSSRISVTSLQQGVLDRLRDAPPKYETRHNYSHHQKTTTTPIGGVATDSAVPPDENQSNSISQISGVVQTYAMSAPPPYDPADDQPLSTSPPSYTAATTPEEIVKAELYQKLYGENTTTGRHISTSELNI